MLKFLSSLLKGRTAKALGAPAKGPQREEPQLPRAVLEKAVLAETQERLPEQRSRSDDDLYQSALVEALDFGQLSSARAQALTASAALSASAKGPEGGEIAPAERNGAQELAESTDVAAPEPPVSPPTSGIADGVLARPMEDPAEAASEDVRSALPADPAASALSPRIALAEDVVAAYKLFLGRLPESTDVVQLRVGYPLDKLLFEFMASAECLGSESRTQLVLSVAMQVLLEQKSQLEEEVTV